MRRGPQGCRASPHFHARTPHLKKPKGIFPSFLGGPSKLHLVTNHLLGQRDIERSLDDNYKLFFLVFSFSISLCDARAHTHRTPYGHRGWGRGGSGQRLGPTLKMEKTEVHRQQVVASRRP